MIYNSSPDVVLAHPTISQKNISLFQDLESSSGTAVYVFAELLIQFSEAKGRHCIVSTR